MPWTYTERTQSKRVCCSAWCRELTWSEFNSISQKSSRHLQRNVGHRAWTTHGTMRGRYRRAGTCESTHDSFFYISDHLPLGGHTMKAIHFQGYPSIRGQYFLGIYKFHDYNCHFHKGRIEKYGLIRMKTMYVLFSQCVHDHCSSPCIFLLLNGQITAQNVDFQLPQGGSVTQISSCDRYKKNIKS